MLDQSVGLMDDEALDMGPYGSNPLRYVGNAPTNATDPSGLWGETAVPNSTITPFELGWEWLKGTGPKNRDFGPDDYMTKELQKHDHIQQSSQDMKDKLKGRCAAQNEDDFTMSYPYSLAGWDGVTKYIYDYSTIATGGLTGNLVVTYLGSYGMKITASDVDCCNHTAKLTFVVNNSTTLASGTRPPVIGYTSWWEKNISPYLNEWAQDGGMSKTTQTFTWTEDVSF